MTEKKLLQTKGVLGEKTYKLLRRIPIEAIEIDEKNRVVLRLLRHVDREDANTLLIEVERRVKEDRVEERKELEELVKQK